MGDIGAAGRAWIFVCITCRAATDPADAPDADAPALPWPRLPPPPPRTPRTFP